MAASRGQENAHLFQDHGVSAALSGKLRLYTRKIMQETTKVMMRLPSLSCVDAPLGIHQFCSGSSASKA